MASLPPQRPVSQRRASPPAEASSSAEYEQIDRTNSFSAASVDSQTLLLNPPSSQAAKPAETAQTEPSVQTPPQSQQEDIEPRRCWICFNDETEDDETTSAWRSPCPCVLVAHEKCLLDWIADMEAPSSRRRAGGNAGKILCPQCKSEIRLERPRSWIVDTVRVVERLTGMMLLPGFIFVTATTAYTTLRLAGTNTIYQVFGPEDALQILEPLYHPPSAHETSAAVRLLSHLRDHWRLDLGLPVIPTVLIASRTSVADSFLPFLPLVFFAGGGAAQEELLQFSWPPSAAFTIATLPYLRGIYNAYYERVWLPREQRWLKEIQPRAGTEDAINAEIQLQDAHVHDANLDALADDTDDEGDNEVVEIEVDFDIFADWNNGGAADNHNAAENPPVPIARGPAHPIDAPPLEDEAPPLGHADGHHRERNQDAAPAPNIPLQPAQPHRQRIRRERNIGFSTTSLADTILGALIFPSIAAAVGEALKYALPKSWVTLPPSGKPAGFLQARWGRSIIGGCLFVGMKDAILLYVRWKMAQNHRMRRVLDYDKSKGRKNTGKI